MSSSTSIIITHFDGWIIRKNLVTQEIEAETITTVSYATGGVEIKIPFLRFIRYVKVEDQTDADEIRRVTVTVTNPPDSNPPKIKVVIRKSTKADTSTGDLIWSEASDGESRTLHILVKGT